MRQVSRLAHRARNIVRKPPRPRWLRPLQIVGGGFACLLALGWGLHELAVRGLIDDALAVAEAEALAVSADAGLVVHTVYSEGRERTSGQDLQRLFAGYEGKSIFTVDTEALRRQLEALTWVKSATVARRLPDTIWVELDEHEPMAIWLDKGTRRLVDERGAVIPVTDLSRFYSLPLIAGDGAPARAEALFQSLAVEPALARRVTAASLIGNRRWNVYLDHRIEVRLPETRTEEAWRFLATQQRETALLARAIAAIDLRQENWLVLRLVDEALPQPGPGKGQGA
jgi:cell division protein FtsQ